MSSAPHQSSGGLSRERDGASVHSATPVSTAVPPQRPADRPPIPEVQRHPRAHHARDAGAPGGGGPQTNGPATLRGGVVVGQQRQGGRHDERGAGAGRHPRRDDLRRSIIDHRRHRGDREHDQPAAHRRAVSVAVAHRARRQQQAGQHDGVSVHEPVELGLRGRRGGRQVSQRGVESHHRTDDQRHCQTADHQRTHGRRCARHVQGLRRV